MACALAENILYYESLSDYQMKPLVSLISDFEVTVRIMLNSLDDDDSDDYYLSKELGMHTKFLTMLVAKSFTVEYNSMTDTEKENNKELKEKADLIENSIKNIRDKVCAGYALSYLKTLEKDRLRYIKNLILF